MTDRLPSQRPWYYPGFKTAIVLLPVLVVIWWLAARIPVDAPMGGSRSWFSSSPMAPVTGILRRPPNFYEVTLRALPVSTLLVAAWFGGLYFLRSRNRRPHDNGPQP